MKTIPQLLAEELGCKEEYVNNVVSLLDEGNTIPFIARYRKEAHGSLDAQLLRQITDPHPPFLHSPLPFPQNPSPPFYPPSPTKSKVIRGTP